MTRLEKCEYLKNNGYTYNSLTGKIINKRGKELISKDDRGYSVITVRNSKATFQLWGHHFAWYMTYGNVEFQMLDHINRDKSDNRIHNLRPVTSSENLHNQESRGYWFDSTRNKWASAIKINGVRKSLGRFDTEKEALDAYLKIKNNLRP